MARVCTATLADREEKVDVNTRYGAHVRKRVLIAALLPGQGRAICPERVLFHPSTSTLARALAAALSDNTNDLDDVSLSFIGVATRVDSVLTERKEGSFLNTQN